MKRFKSWFISWLRAWPRSARQSRAPIALDAALAEVVAAHEASVLLVVLTAADVVESAARAFRSSRSAIACVAGAVIFAAAVAYAFGE